MLFKCILFSQQYIGNKINKAIGDQKGNAIGNGTSVAQAQRNKTNVGRSVKCPNFDICQCSSSYSNSKRYFFGNGSQVGHFKKLKFVGCLKAFNQLTREELVTPQWHSFAKYHPKFGAKV